MITDTDDNEFHNEMVCGGIGSTSSPLPYVHRTHMLVAASEIFLLGNSTQRFTSGGVSPSLVTSGHDGATSRLIHAATGFLFCLLRFKICMQHTTDVHIVSWFRSHVIHSARNYTNYSMSYINAYDPSCTRTNPIPRRGHLAICVRGLASHMLFKGINDVLPLPIHKPETLKWNSPRIDKVIRCFDVSNYHKSTYFSTSAGRSPIH